MSLRMNLLNMPERKREPLEPGDKAYLDISMDHDNIIPIMLKLNHSWVTIESHTGNHSTVQGHMYRIVGHSFYWNDHMFSKVIRKNPNKSAVVKRNPGLPTL